MVLVLGHEIPYSIMIDKSPGAKLLQDADFGEDVELRELGGLFFDTERIAIGRFSLVLPARVLVEDLWSIDTR